MLQLLNCPKCGSANLNTGLSGCLEPNCDYGIPYNIIPESEIYLDHNTPPENFFTDIFPITTAELPSMELVGTR